MRAWVQLCHVQDELAEGWVDRRQFRLRAVLPAPERQQLAQHTARYSLGISPTLEETGDKLDINAWG